MPTPSALAVQANPPHWYQDIQDCFTAAWESDFGEGSSSGTRTEEINRGREEIRGGPGINRPTGLRDAAVWKGLTAIGMVFCRRVVDGVASEEVRYSIGSCVGTAEEDRRAIRGPWGIENSVPGVRDGVFREDASRHPAGTRGANLALLRKFAIRLLKQDHPSPDSLKTKRLRGGWDDAYLTKVLTMATLGDA